MTHGVGSSSATPTDNSTMSLHEIAKQRRAASMSASSNPQGISKEIANPETTQKSKSKANETFNIFNTMRANFEKNRNIQILKKLLAPVFVIISVFKKIYPSSAKNAHQEPIKGKTSNKSDTSSPKASRSESKVSVKVSDESEVPRLKSSEELKFEAFVAHPETMSLEDKEKLDSFLKSPRGGSLLDHLAKLGDNEATRDSFVFFAETMGTNLTPPTCSALMEKLSDKAGFEIAKQLSKNELDHTPSTPTGLSTLFRANSIAARMITAYQTQVMVKETASELNGIFERLPEQPYLLREVDIPAKDKGRTAKIIKKDQERIMTDFSNIMKELDSFTKSEKFPSQIKELNKFIETEVNAKFHGEGAKFAPQFFFLRFFNSALPQGAGFNKALPKRTEKQTRVGVQLVKLVQTIVNQAHDRKEEHLNFYYDEIEKQDNPEVALFKGISERIRTP